MNLVTSNNKEKNVKKKNYSANAGKNTNKKKDGNISNGKKSSNAKKVSTNNRKSANGKKKTSTVKSIEREVLENRKHKKIVEDTDIDVIEPSLGERKSGFFRKFDKLRIKYKKDPKLFMIVVCLLIFTFLLVIGSSYAYFVYETKTNRVTGIVSGDLVLEFYNESNAITLSDALPQQDNDALEFNDEFDFMLKNNGDINANYVVTLDNTCSVNNSYSINGSSVKPSKCIPDDYVKVAIKEKNGDYKVLNKKDNQFVIESGSIGPGSVKTYKMKIWLDWDTPSSYNPSGDEVVIYSGKIGLSYKQGKKNLDYSGANVPNLSDNMIPVYYDSSLGGWRKADSSNSDEKYKWYDYNNKMWANSVTVSLKDGTRDDLLFASNGTEIPMDRILTMQVWIPRYKYRVWNYNSSGTSSSDLKEIEVTFENGTDGTGDISCSDSVSGTDGSVSEVCKFKEKNCTDDLCNDKTYTHPAFTFGDKELTGIWVGKFETTGTVDEVTVKPNVNSLTDLSVSDFEKKLMAMKTSNNIYGFSDGFDTHVAKNMEWGAIAYLTNSRYGRCADGTCTEVTLNNCTKQVTGIAADSVSGEMSDSICDSSSNRYNTEKGVLASTTGNVYGIYDMSGGANEYTMANVVSPDGTNMISGIDSANNSLYTGKLYDSGKYTSYTGNSYPDNAYYDRYSFTSLDTSIVGSRLGDAIKEVRGKDSLGWNLDLSSFANPSGPWFYRGGSYNNTTLAGIFYSGFNSGAASDRRGVRLIIAP